MHANALDKLQQLLQIDTQVRFDQFYEDQTHPSNIDYQSYNLELGMGQDTEETIMKNGKNKQNKAEDKDQKELKKQPLPLILQSLTAIQLLNVYTHDHFIKKILAHKIHLPLLVDQIIWRITYLLGEVFLLIQNSLFVDGFLKDSLLLSVKQIKQAAYGLVEYQLSQRYHRQQLHDIKLKIVEFYPNRQIDVKARIQVYNFMLLVWRSPINFKINIPKINENAHFITSTAIVNKEQSLDSADYRVKAEDYKWSINVNRYRQILGLKKPKNHIVQKQGRENKQRGMFKKAIKQNKVMMQIHPDKSELSQPINLKINYNTSLPNQHNYDISVATQQIYPPTSHQHNQHSLSNLNINLQPHQLALPPSQLDIDQNYKSADQKQLDIRQKWSAQEESILTTTFIARGSLVECSKKLQQMYRIQNAKYSLAGVKRRINLIVHRVYNKFCSLNTQNINIAKFKQNWDFIRKKSSMSSRRQIYIHIVDIYATMLNITPSKAKHISTKILQIKAICDAEKHPQTHYNLCDISSGNC